MGIPVRKLTGVCEITTGHLHDVQLPPAFEGENGAIEVSVRLEYGSAAVDVGGLKSGMYLFDPYANTMTDEVTMSLSGSTVSGVMPEVFFAACGNPLLCITLTDPATGHKITACTAPMHVQNVRGSVVLSMRAPTPSEVVYVGRAPYINKENARWMVWDNDAQQYTDSGVNAVGDGAGLYLPVGGTAANATRLNGKDAVYYLGARNLLDNSNFKDFIAQAGLNGLHGTQSYLGDRWVSSEIVVSASDKNGIALTSDSQFGNVTQMVAVTVGRPYTLVVKGQGEDFLAIVSNSAGSTISSARFVDGQAVCVFTAGEDIAHINLYIGFVDGGGTATLEWTALYEGTYTADNLPPYVAPDPVLELAKCKNAYKIIYVTMKPTFMSGSVRVYRLAYGDIRPTLNAPTIEILSADERNVWSSTGATFTVEAVDQSAKAALIYASGATVDNVDNCYADIRIACIADL